MGVIQMEKEDVIISNQRGLEKCIKDNTYDLSKELQVIKEQQTLIIDYLENIYRIINN
jgi:hypothetical protein